MLEREKTLARWAAPAIALLALYMAVWGVPSLPVTLLLAGGGLVLSWGTPWVVKKVRALLS